MSGGDGVGKTRRKEGKGADGRRERGGEKWANPWVLPGSGAGLTATETELSASAVTVLDPYTYTAE